jgi:P27 family predicted phage terminase small subunit
MVRGRKPIPTHLKILHGNPGKRPLNEAEPTPPADRPERPPHLAGEAAAEWDRVCELLDKMGLLSSADRAVIAAFCEAWGRWVEAEAMVRKIGAVIVTKEKTLYQNPYLAVANKAIEQFTKLAAELGLTPSSRSRVKTTKPQTKTGIQARVRA